ncbi:MAG: FAD-binding protein [Reyranella sp.]|uniref:FAD-dependent oxidoreductase n=1 Tax=Reyranella sp. TaxID=1929291 RepID=UPI003D14F642
MNRRTLLTLAGGLPLMSTAHAQDTPRYRRNRPGDPGWPSDGQWRELDARVGGQLLVVRSPMEACRAQPGSAECAAFFRGLKNPWLIGDSVALTQTTGWVDAWTSTPSTYAVAARNSSDVAAAVDFARQHRLRLVVKGGGHSYQGTSNAPDSLLLWTRRMDGIELHDDFVGQGCNAPPQPAVSLGAGVVWLRAYDAASRAGRYVQGGGCTTVGVAGLIQSGGFGTFSKRYGMAAAGLIEAEVVTADGQVRIANACTNPDLFWALKGGGGGSFGVVTRITLRTRELPEFFGGVFITVQARSAPAYRDLIQRFLAFYRERLFNPHWGEQVTFRPDNALAVALVFQGLDAAAATELWRPFVAWLAERPADFTLAAPPMIAALPARHFWDADWMKANAPDFILSDDRPGARPDNIFWRNNLGEAGWFIQGYESVWMPGPLIEPARQDGLIDALFAGSRHWRITLHFNKGLAGAPADEVAAARDTATHPVAADAFALAISASEAPPAFPGVAGREPDLALARRNAAKITAAMDEIRRLVPDHGSYVSESNYYEVDWRRAFWGTNYARLRQVKDKYDADGLFFVHHGVGSEDWSADGNTRLR